jgi:transcription antitermination factor NusG
MEQSTKNWYVAYTKPLQEKKVAGTLTRNKIENFNPQNKIRNERKKEFSGPLFKSFVFIHVPFETLEQIKKTNGIINYLHWHGKPAIINKAEIEAIKSFISEHDNVELEKVKVNTEDKVKIFDGPYIKRDRNVIEIRQKSVKVLLPSMGYILKAEVEKADHENINVFADTHQYPALFSQPGRVNQ